MQLLRAKALRRAVISATVVGLALQCVRAQTRAPVRSVRFAITDCWGGEIPSITKSVNGVDAQATRERLSYPGETSVRLSQGRYHAIIEAQGFFPNSFVIEPLERDLEIRRCLTLAPIEGTLRFRVDLTGSLSADVGAKNGPRWIRLVGLYSDINVTTQVSADNRFSFQELQPGQYLLLLFDANGLKTKKEIEVRATSTTVTLP